ncbi:MAG: oligosaccharide flippase family protein [Myxococcota bacterium]
MSRARKVLVGGLATVLKQVLVLGVGLWLTPFLIGQFGVDGYGLWAVGLQAIGYLNLLDLGTFSLLPRDVPRARAEAGGDLEHPDVRSVVKISVVTAIPQTALIALATLIGLLVLPDDWERIAPALQVAGIAFVLSFPGRVFIQLLTGLQDFAFVTGVSTLSWAVQTGVMVGLVLAGHGMVALGWGWAAGALTRVVVSAVRVATRYPALLRLRGVPIAPGRVLEQYQRGGWRTVNKLSFATSRGMDLLWIDRAIGPEAVADYNVTVRLSTIARTTVNIVLPFVLPGLSELRGEGDLGRLTKVTRALTLGLLVLQGGAGCVVIAVTGGFVGEWVGVARYVGLALVIFAVVGTLVISATATLGSTLFALGRERANALGAVAEALGFVTLAALLVGPFGVLGVAAAPTLAALGLRWPIVLRVLSEELDEGIGPLFRTLFPWMWRMAIGATGAALVATHAPPRSYLEVALVAAAVGVVYLALMGRVLLRGPLAPYAQAGLRRLGLRRAPPAG